MGNSFPNGLKRPDDSKCLNRFRERDFVDSPGESHRPPAWGTSVLYKHPSGLPGFNVPTRAGGVADKASPRRGVWAGHAFAAYLSSSRRAVADRSWGGGPE